MNDFPLGQSFPAAQQLSPWQARQAAMLYWYSSLEYLHKFHLLLTQMVEGHVDPALSAPSRRSTFKVLGNAQWGIQDAFKVPRPCPFNVFDSLKRSVAGDISARRKGMYKATAMDNELRKIEEYRSQLFPCEEEHQYQQSLALINHYGSSIDSLFHPFPSPRWEDFEFACQFPSFAEESPIIPKFRIRTDITGDSGQPAPYTGVYIAVNEPHASLQFAVANDKFRKMNDASTFSKVGMDALHTIGRDHLWFNEIKMYEFAIGHKIWPQFRKGIEICGTHYPELAPSSVALHAFETRGASWHFVETIPGEFENVGLANVVIAPPALPAQRTAGELCRQSGYYFSIKHVGSNRFYSVGDVFPSLEEAGNQTIWQWSEN